MLAPIHTGPDALRQLIDQLTELAPTKIGLLMDRNTEAHCAKWVVPHLPPHHTFVIEAGEAHKNLRTCESLWQQLLDLEFDRRSVLINLGGGVVGDLGGFVAGCFKRGIRYLQIPTTLLAMVDASIGGKTGVDFRGGKNLIGMFKQPEGVFVDPVFLSSLPQRELVSGFAEVVKHWLIGDVAAWKKYSQVEGLPSDWHAVIREAIEVKKKVVEIDPFEQGLRKSLNFGHTIGHALESCSLETATPLLHGEAVAVGMVAECFIASQRGVLSEIDYQAVKTYLQARFPVAEAFAQTIDPAKYLAYLRHDKKNEAGKILLAWIKGIGEPEWNVEVTESEVALDWGRLF